MEAARQEGDLRENAGYHAAREEAGLNEARIAQLTELLGKDRETLVVFDDFDVMGKDHVVAAVLDDYICLIYT